MRYLPLRCGEEANVLNRRVRFESVSPAENTTALSVPPSAVLSISYPDGSSTSKYQVEQGGAGESGDRNRNLSDLFIIDTDKPLGDEGLGTGTPSADK